MFTSSGKNPRETEWGNLKPLRILNTSVSHPSSASTSVRNNLCGLVMSIGGLFDSEPKGKVANEGEGCVNSNFPQHMGHLTVKHHHSVPVVEKVSVKEEVIDPVFLMDQKPSDMLQTITVSQDKSLDHNLAMPLSVKQESGDRLLSRIMPDSPEVPGTSCVSSGVSEQRVVVIVKKEMEEMMMDVNPELLVTDLPFSAEQSNQLGGASLCEQFGYLRSFSAPDASPPPTSSQVSLVQELEHLKATPTKEKPGCAGSVRTKKIVDLLRGKPHVRKASAATLSARTYTMRVGVKAREILLDAVGNTNIYENVEGAVSVVLEEPKFSFACIEDTEPLPVTKLEESTISITSKTKKSVKKRATRLKSTVKPDKPTLTHEERERRKEQMRQAQYATWTEKPVINHAELCESEVESVPTEDSDFLGSDQEENSEDSGKEEEDLFENFPELRPEWGKKSLKPAVKDGSVFTLDFVAEILQTTVDQLDSEKWVKEIAQVDDKKILPKLVNLRNGYRRYRCYMCGIQVHGTPSEMEEHMRDVHDSSLAFGCFFCPLARPTEKHLVIHEQRHVFYYRKGICTICDMCHLPNTDIDWPPLHAKCHPPFDEIRLWKPADQVKVYEYCHAPNCTATKKAFANASCLATHMAVYHLGGSDICDVCGKDGFSLWGYKRHRTLCLLKKEKMKICKICGTKRKNLSGHNCSGKFNCKLCDAKFTNSHGLRRHTANIHGNKRHVCEICRRAFAEKKVLEDHLNTHTGAKPYQCLACGGWYTSQASLAMHLKSRHNLTTKQMREKYKIAPVSELPVDDIVKEDNGESEIVSKHKVNKYTGRKRGRPKVRQSEGQEEGDDDPVEFEDEKDVILYDPNIVRKSGAAKMLITKREVREMLRRGDMKIRKKSAKKKASHNSDGDRTASDISMPTSDFSGDVSDEIKL